MPDFSISSGKYSEFRELPAGLDYERFCGKIGECTVDELSDEFKDRIEGKSDTETESWSDLDLLAREIALKVLHDSGETEPPIDPDKVVKAMESSFGIEFKLKEDVFDGNAATITPSKGGFNIYYGFSDAEKKRYLLGHELGHSLAYDCRDLEHGKRPCMLHEATGLIGLTGESKEEFIADSFALEILLPYSQSSKTLYDDLASDLEEIERFRKDTKVDPTIFRRRFMDELGYFQDSCLMEISKENDGYRLDHGEEGGLRYRFGPCSKGDSFSRKVENVLARMNRKPGDLDGIEEEIRTVECDEYEIQTTPYKDRILCLVTER